ncbi:hypothetical protein CLAIMM_05943 isoform 2 [Cladophialophora immunda]|nr:hypothetical protein CLAIMM_05943 isoform 2 [Cladophialophora immunda]
MTASPPLTGVRVLELAGLAPGPFCGLLLANWGANVLRVDRPSPVSSSDLLTSWKRSIALDLKNPSSVAVFLSLVSIVDVLIDPFRPGVLEKLGLDPETVLLKKNPRLIVVRLTGFRRDGKYSAMAGHDINYLAVSGVLSMLGARGSPPAHPANILADFAGGGHAAFTGVLLALIHRATSGKGQVVEANMVVPGKLDRLDKRAWPYMRELFTKRFREKTRKEWEAIFDGTDACCAPVLEHAEMEAAGYDHRPIVGLTSSPARKVEMQWDGKALKPGEGGEQALRDWMGWSNGKDYAISASGCFEKREKSKL